MDLNTANIKKIRGVHLVRLTGTSSERATQHGRLVASLQPEERKTLAILPLATKNQSLLKKATGKIPGVSQMFSSFYEAFVLRQFLKLPRAYRNRLKPFAAASHIKEKHLWLALYQPDLLMVLAAKGHGNFLSGMPGCTTGAIEKNGELLFLRNLDYPAAGHFEKWPAVFYHEPSDPYAQHYVSIGSLGVHTPGLTGWNESGIAFSLHAHFSKKVNLKGLPVFFLGEDILENARSFEEAIRHCRHYKTIGSWAINIISFKEKKAATVELSNGTFTITPLNADQILSHSNGFTHEKFKADEIYFSGSFFEDLDARKTGLEKILSKFGNTVSVDDAISALASHVDYKTGETRVFGNTVSVVTTIQSVVIEGATNRLFLSIRGETPTALGPFMRLPLRWEELNSALESEELLYPKPRHEEPFLDALHAYHEAYVAWQVVGQGSKKAAELALSFLIQACEFQPQDPHLLLQRGYFELLNNQFKSAHECFRTALHFKLSDHHRDVAEYFLAITLDLLQERTEALYLYRKLLERTSGTPLDAKLKLKTRLRLTRPFLRSYCQKIEPDLQFVEPIQYP